MIIDWLIVKTDGIVHKKRKKRLLFQYFWFDDLGFPYIQDGNISRGRTKGSLFNSYFTEV